MKLFISGWAGFREALGDIPEDWDFINPFLDFDEEGILNFLGDKTGEILVGWSTGGHIVLKNLTFFYQRFNKIIIIAGFKKFTNYVHPRVIKRMIEKMKNSPKEVIEEFLINAGTNPLLPEKIEYEKLIKGLEFLISSQVSDFPSEHAKLTLIQGKNDKILPLKALEDLKFCFPFARTYVIDSPHWITFNELLKVKTSGIT